MATSPPYALENLPALRGECVDPATGAVNHEALRALGVILGEVAGEPRLFLA
jgi:hypothetical protein